MSEVAMKPEIRVLKEADAADFWKLRLRGLKEDPEAFGASFGDSVNVSHEDICKRLVDTEDAFALGAFNPNPCGMLGFYRRQGERVRHKGGIWGVYVAPEARGTGLARRLMLEAIERAKKMPDLEEVILTVSTTQGAAMKLYESLGFKEYGHEVRALKQGDIYIDEKMMMLRLHD